MTNYTIMSSERFGSRVIFTARVPADDWARKTVINDPNHLPEELLLAEAHNRFSRMALNAAST